MLSGTLTSAARWMIASGRSAATSAASAPGAATSSSCNVKARVPSAAARFSR